MQTSRYSFRTGSEKIGWAYVILDDYFLLKTRTTAALTWTYPTLRLTYQSVLVISQTDTLLTYQLRRESQKRASPTACQNRLIGQSRSFVYDACLSYQSTN